MDIRPPNHVMAWLGPLIIINVFIWVVTRTPQANAAICSDSENCLADWVGALSGWVAAGAAYLTIRTMNAQRAEANQYQRENVELQIMDRLALARRLDREFGGSTARFYQAIRDGMAKATTDEDRKQIISSFPVWRNSIEAKLGDPLLAEYDDKIGIRSKAVVNGLRIALRVAEATVEEHDGYAAYPVSWPQKYKETQTDALNRIGDCYEGATQFFTDLDDEVWAFIERWSAKI